MIGAGYPMYERFFGFSDQPFRLTPDPKYLYLGGKHREGYAHLLYALREGTGFVAVTGEIGAGKTTLVRALLRERHPDIAVAYIFNPVLSSIELLQTINAEFGLPSRSTSKKELTDALNNFLLAQKAAAGRAVVIVDEAQNLDPSVLEQLRLLSNLETETDKLLQIILLGQPELRALLDRADLRQLSQRIALRWHLEPLNRGETAEYVQHRVAVASGPRGLFQERALDLIHGFSGGIPRLINILAHRALLVAYTRGMRTVGRGEVEAAAAELEECRIPVRRKRSSAASVFARLGAAVGLAAAAAFVAFVLVAPFGDDLPQHGADDPDGEQPHVAAAEREEPSGARGPDRSRTGQDKPRVPALSAAAAADRRADDNDRGAQAAVQRLARRLQRVDPYETAAAGMSRLLEHWTERGLTAAEVAAGSLDLQLFGARRGLRYLAAELTPAQLAALDLPAIVELTIPEEGVRYVLVERLGDHGATIYLDEDKPVRVERAALERLWRGGVHVLWRDRERLSRPLTAGARGPAVTKLQELLARAGYYEGATTGEYDENTLQAVRRLQTAHGLEPTGEASTLTQILLYNAVGAGVRPALGRARHEGEFAATGEAS